jgi:hypothetical protein
MQTLKALILGQKQDKILLKLLKERTQYFGTDLLEYFKFPNSETEVRQ